MFKKVIIVSVVAFSSGAYAEWKDVAYTAHLPNEAIYCDGLGNLRDFVGHVQDQNVQGAMQMVADGDCRMTSGRMEIQVIQEESVDEVISFIAPSGKGFYTLKGYTQQ